MPPYGAAPKVRPRPSYPRTVGEERDDDLRERLRDDLHADVADRLRTVGQRFTANRRAVVDVLERAERPLTIAEILDGSDGLARSSVYRNLVVLEEAGAVRRVVTEHEYARYELTEDLTDHHHHLVCVRCGAVEDVRAGEALERSMRQAIADIDEATGFHTQHHRLDLVGLCRRCARAAAAGGVRPRSPRRSAAG